MNKTTIFAFLGIVAGVGAFLLWQTSQAPQSLNPDLYPLYSAVQWGPSKSAMVDGAQGYEIVSQPITNITDIAASSTPFTAYYQDKLTKAGWVADMAREAGGPGAEVSVYTKGRDFIVVEFHSDFKNKPADAPEQCPCDLTFMLVSGTTK